MDYDQLGEGSPYRTALRQLRPALLQVAVFSAAVNLLMLTGPAYMLQIYDRLLPSGSVELLLQFFGVVVGLYAFLGVNDFIRRRRLSRAAERLDALLGELAFRQRPGASDPLRDLATLRGFLSGPAVLSLFDLPWIPVFLVTVALIHPALGWLALAGAVVAVGLAWANERVARGPLRRALELDDAERDFTAATRRSGELVHALGMETAVGRHWRGLHERALAALRPGSDRSETVSALSRSFRLVLQSLLLTGGAYYTLRGEITAGMIVAVSILSGRALAPLDQAVGNWRAIARARAAHRALGVALAAPRPLRPAPDDADVAAPKGRLELDGVGKRRPGSTGDSPGDRILAQVSFRLEPGDGLGVVGASGAGKSSLARLLVSAWTPDAGRILLDGRPLDQWGPDRLGPAIGYLPQHVELLPGTVAQNIARFAPDATAPAITAAARAAGARRMIESLPEGYNTRVGQADQPLSGGQVQRLGLARALYGDPRLVVLDEPDAHLDPDGEAVLKHAIERLRARGVTVVVMAHRPATLAPLDRVLLLHNGLVAYAGDKGRFMRRRARPVGIARRPAPAGADGAAP